MDPDYGWTKEEKGDLRKLSVIIASDGKDEKASFLPSRNPMQVKKQLQFCKYLTYFSSFCRGRI